MTSLTAEEAVKRLRLFAIKSYPGEPNDPNIFDAVADLITRQAEEIERLRTGGEVDEIRGKLLALLGYCRDDLDPDMVRGFQAIAKDLAAISRRAVLSA